MANETGFSMDFTEFDRNFFRHVEQTVPEAGLTALDRTAPDLLADAIKEEPRAPHLTGNLWRSQAVEPAQRVGGNLEKLAGFAAEYAAAQHEAPEGRNMTLEGSGPKFLESKLAKNKERYMGRVAAELKEISGQ